MAGMQETLHCSLVWERVLCCAEKLETLGCPFVRTLWQCSGFTYLQRLLTLEKCPKVFNHIFFSWNRDMDRWYRPFLNSYPDSISTWLVRDSTRCVQEQKTYQMVCYLGTVESCSYRFRDVSFGWCVWVYLLYRLVGFYVEPVQIFSTRKKDYCILFLKAFVIIICRLTVKHVFHWVLNDIFIVWNTN